MSSVCAHYGSYLGYLGWAEHQIQLYCLDVAHQLCSRFFVNTGTWQTNERWKNPQDILYGELTARKRNPGRFQFFYRDVCKRDIEELSIGENNWEELATDGSKWKRYLQVTLKVEKITSLENKCRPQESKINNCQPCSYQYCD